MAKVILCWLQLETRILYGTATQLIQLYHVVKWPLSLVT